MRSSFFILFFTMFYSLAFCQDPYVFISPFTKSEAIERNNLIKANVKQRNTFYTRFSDSGKLIEKRKQTYTTKYNQAGTTSIGEFMFDDSTKNIQIFEYKENEILTTDIKKDKNGAIISSNTMKHDKNGHLIREGRYKKWSIDTINDQVISYRETTYYLNGKKGYSNLYIVSSSNDSLISRDLDPQDNISSETRYYYDSVGNVTKEIRDLGTFYYKYDSNNNLIESLEYDEGKLKEKRENKYDANNLLIQERIYSPKSVLLIIIDYEYINF